MQNEDQSAGPDNTERPSSTPDTPAPQNPQSNEPGITQSDPEPVDGPTSSDQSVYSNDADGETSDSDDDEFSFDPNSIVSWTGPEFIHHQKKAGWYMVYAAVAVIVVVIVYLVTKDILSTVVIAAGALTFGIYSARKPREITYVLTPSGIKISQKAYGLENFRSFAVVEEVGVDNIVFLPLKRFSLSLTICFPVDLEERIVDLLSPVMPQSDYQHDAVDRLMHRIRF